MFFYIGGGVGGAVLVVCLIVVVAMSFEGGGGGRKAKDQNIRFGLTESRRRQLFSDLFHAVDVNGISKECKSEWRTFWAAK